MRFFRLRGNSVWTVRDARIVLLARTVSTAGNALTNLAALLLLHDAGVGPYGIAALLACATVPTIATMGIAGRVADSHDSRRILVLTSVAQALACAVLGAAAQPAVIYPAMVLIALAQSFAQPTWSALLPRVVNEERIGQAIAWQQGLGAVAAPAGAAISGVLVGMGAARWAFWADAVSYLILVVAALALHTRRQPSKPADGATSPRWSDGIRTLMRDRLVWPLFTALLVFVVLVEGINPVEVFLARDVLGATAWQYGLGEIFAGVGAVVGAAVAGRVVTSSGRAHTATIGFGIAALSLIAAGNAPNFWFYATLLAVLSASFGSGNATFGALLTSRTPESERGRVYAALGGLARTGSLLALVLGSTANLLLGPRTSFIIAGAAGAVVMAVAFAKQRPALRNAAEVTDLVDQQ